MTNKNTAKKNEKINLDFLAISVCSNCASQEECSVLVQATAPILQCEMYQCCSLPRPDSLGNERIVQDAKPESDDVHLLGLCANCENRQSCKWPKPVSGIWHCEDYK